MQAYYAGYNSKIKLLFYQTFQWYKTKLGLAVNQFKKVEHVKQ